MICSTTILHRKTILANEMHFGTNHASGAWPLAVNLFLYSPSLSNWATDAPLTLFQSSYVTCCSYWWRCVVRFARNLIMKVGVVSDFLSSPSKAYFVFAHEMRRNVCLWAVWAITWWRYMAALFADTWLHCLQIQGSIVCTSYASRLLINTWVECA